MDSLGKNEKIVSQIQNGIGDRQELFTELWIPNIGLVRKIIHMLTGLQYGHPPDKEDFEDLEQQAFLRIMERTTINLFGYLYLRQVNYGNAHILVSICDNRTPIFGTQLVSTCDTYIYI